MSSLVPCVLVQIAVLASGTGTILQALISAGLPIAVLVVDRTCGAEGIAATAGIDVERVVRASFGVDFDREGFTDDVVAALVPHEVSLIAMAGYGTVLGPSIHDAYPGRILNTHPALLPAFKGWHAVEQALAAGVPETGCSVHIATIEVDDGPILAQERVKILPGDTPASLHDRIKEVERRLYPATIFSVLEGSSGSVLEGSSGSVLEGSSGSVLEGSSGEPAGCAGVEQGQRVLEQGQRVLEQGQRVLEQGQRVLEQGRPRP